MLLYPDSQMPFCLTDVSDVSITLTRELIDGIGSQGEGGAALQGEVVFYLEGFENHSDINCKIALEDLADLSGIDKRWFANKWDTEYCCYRLDPGWCHFVIFELLRYKCTNAGLKHLEGVAVLSEKLL